MTYTRRYRVTVNSTEYETDAISPYDVYFNERDKHGHGTIIMVKDLYSGKEYHYRIGKD